MSQQYIFYSSVGGSGSGGGVQTYANQASLPVSAAGGTLAVTLDTNTLWVFDSGSSTWKAIGKPGDVLTVSSTNSINLTDVSNNLTADLRLSSNTADAGFLIVSNDIESSGVVGLRSQISNSSILGLISGTAPVSYNNSTGVISMHVADSTHDGYLLQTDWSTFNNKQPSISIGALDAQAANATGLSLVSNVLSTQSADATHPGLVNITTQSFAGNKTFTGSISASNLSGTNTGDITIGAFGSTPNANGLSLSGTTTLTSYTAGAGNASATSDTVTWTGMGFKTTVAGSITDISVALKTVGTAPTGTLTLLIYDNSGILPNSIVATSSAVSLGTLSSSYQYINFNFPTPFSAVVGTRYYWILDTASTVFGGGGSIFFEGDSLGGTYPGGNGVTSTNAGGSYTDSPTKNFDFQVFNIGASGQVLNLQPADSTHSGGLSSADWNTFNNKGSVSSVAMTVPSIMSVSGSPITTTGTLAVTLNTESANLVFAGPTSGGAATPTFRSLVAADIPSISLTSGVSGVLPIANGGTNSSTSLSNNRIIQSSGGALVEAAAITASRALKSDANGIPVASTATAASLDALSGTNTGDQTITLTGDVTGSGTGSFAATIANNSVTNAKLAQMAAHTFKGNNTGSTANALDLTQTQLTAEMNNFVGDSGAGGTKGMVPAPAAGDAAASKFLKADGTWSAPFVQPALNYFSGYMPNATSWLTTSTTYADPANTGSNTLTTRFSSGLTVTAAASNLPGITWTPNANTDVFYITASVAIAVAGGAGSIRLYDGTNEVSSLAVNVGVLVTTISGIYAPATTSAVTLKAQLANSSGVATVIEVAGGTLASSIEWTVLQIK